MPSMVVIRSRSGEIGEQPGQFLRLNAVILEIVDTGLGGIGVEIGQQPHGIESDIIEAPVKIVEPLTLRVTDAGYLRIAQGVRQPNRIKATVIHEVDFDL